jgi:outer membrane protein assembly factor BamB
MPADLDELFAAFAAHADAVPSGTADAARRLGRRRRQYRVASTALVALLVLGVATFTTIRALQPRVLAATPRPTVSFAPLTAAYSLASPLDQAPDVRLVGSRLFMLSVGTSSADPQAPAGPGIAARLDALDLSTMTAPFPAISAGLWQAAPTLVAGPQALLLVGSHDGGTTRDVVAYSATNGSLDWQRPLGGDDVLLSLSTAVVVYEPSSGSLVGLDWTNGHPLWQLTHPMQGTQLVPMRTAPVPDGAVPAGTLVADPQDPRLAAIDADGSVTVIDSSTGRVLSSFGTGRPATQTSYVPFEDRLYIVTPDGVRGVPLDGTGTPTVLFTASVDETVTGVAPCGPRVCVGIAFGSTNLLAGIDPGMATEVWRVPGSRPTVLDGRMLTADGEIYDLAGALLRTDGHAMFDWWLTTGSVLLVDARVTLVNGVEEHDVTAASTVDGRTVDLGDVPVGASGCVTALQRYLACGTTSGVDVWRFTTG